MQDEIAKSAQIYCPGCNTIYDGSKMPIGNPFRCTSRRLFGRRDRKLECGYTFVAFNNNDEGRRQASKRFQEEWSLFQKQLFEKSEINRLFIVYWQERFSRYQPKMISEMAAVKEVLDILINGFTEKLKIVIGVIERDNTNNIYSHYIPSIDSIERYSLPDCLDCYNKADCERHRINDFEELRSSIRWDYTDYSICTFNGIHWRFPLWVGTEMVGCIIAGGLRIDSDQLDPLDTCRQIHRLVKSKNPDSLDKDEKLKGIRFSSPDGHGSTFPLSLKEYIDMYKEFLNISRWIKELIRGVYDRERTLDEELFIREMVSRVERRHEQNLDPSLFFTRIQDALSRVCEYLDLSKIVLLTNRHHHDYFTPKLDSSGTNYPSEGIDRSILSGGASEGEAIRIMNSGTVENLSTSQRAWFLDKSLAIQENWPAINKNKLRQAFSGNLMTIDFKPICVSPINLAISGPIDTGLLVFYSKNTTNIVGHRELYEQIISLLGLMFRAAYAEEKRREEYNRAVHEILEPHNAIKTRMEMTYDMIKIYKKESSENANMVEKFNALFNLENVLRDSLKFSVRLETIADKMKLMMTGQMELHKSLFRVYELIKNTFYQLKSTASSKGVFIKLAHIAQELSRIPEISIDQNLIGQVFYHTIWNAIKYSFKSTTIRFSYSLYSGHDQQTYHVISVHNTGIPIAPDEVERIFERYNRGSNANILDARGSGEGCFVAKTIMEAHGGFYRYRIGNKPESVPAAMVPKDYKAAENIFDIGFPEENRSNHK